MTTLSDLPSDLPIPLDDGACDHLEGLQIPELILPSTNNDQINLSKLSGLTIIYIYPMTGRPDVPLPDGWDQIPGARGCTPQSCSFRDSHEELKEFKASVFGLSTQSTSYQKEAADRLHLTFPLLSDESLQLTEALSLPTMSVNKMTLIKRITLVCNDRKIVKVFYPVFPPDLNIYEVIEFLKINNS